MLICYYACSLLYVERLFCFIYQTQVGQQHGRVYLFTVDIEFIDITAP